MGTVCGFRNPPSGTVCGISNPPSGTVCRFRNPPSGTVYGFRSSPSGTVCGFRSTPLGTVYGFRSPPLGTVCGFRNTPLGSVCGFWNPLLGTFCGFRTLSLWAVCVQECILGASLCSGTTLWGRSMLLLGSGLCSPLEVTCLLTTLLQELVGGAAVPQALPSMALSLCFGLFLPKFWLMSSRSGPGTVLPRCPVIPLDS